MTQQKNDQVDINVKEMSQHVYQHPGEPRDLDYRAQALASAIGYESRDPAATKLQVITTAANFEDYLRNGHNTRA